MKAQSGPLPIMVQAKNPRVCRENGLRDGCLWEGRKARERVRRGGLGSRARRLRLCGGGLRAESEFLGRGCSIDAQEEKDRALAAANDLQER